MGHVGNCESVRTLARYKQLILLGKVSLPLEVARRIVGPDCAYHLYFRHETQGVEAESGKPGRGAKRRRRRTLQR